MCLIQAKIIKENTKYIRDKARHKYGTLSCTCWRNVTVQVLTLRH